MPSSWKPWRPAPKIPPHHCALLPSPRFLPGDKHIIAGNSEDLCNTYGWHDLHGWISSHVISRDTVDRLMVSAQLEIAEPSAYWHQEVLLETAYGRTMLILTAGLIELQDEEQTLECVARWEKANAFELYWRITPGLVNLQQRGIIQQSLTLGFFRYLTYRFWDRFAVQVMYHAGSPETPDEFLETKLRLLHFSSVLLGYGEDRKLYENWFEGIPDDGRGFDRPSS